ncbi:MAG TPA: EAL domain-containing protein [Turneriella sp.]|nr:EAL domain-containing protein [Turneriella sp.]
MAVIMLDKVDTQVFQEGELIFSEGDVSDFAYIIEDGEIEIFTVIGNERKNLNLLTSGSLFGELALVDRQPRSASAVALKRTTLTLVTQQQVNERIQDSDPILRMLLFVVMKHFRSEVARARAQYAPFSRQDIIPDAEKFNQLRLTEAVNMVRLEADLRYALKEKQFRLYYQPIVELSTGRVTSVEALIRWNNPRRGLLSPADFIEIAEATKLILPIGDWVIQEGLSAYQKFHHKVGSSISMSFNVARRQMENTDFLTKLAKDVEASSIDAKRIYLEVLERNFLLRGKIDTWISECTIFGFPISLDDFGTGYSSLRYLQQFRPQVVKIDRSFIIGLPDSNESRSICKAIIDLANALDIRVVAEGIETMNQAKALSELGCQFGQGYLFSKPVPEIEFIHFLEKQAS